MPLNSKLKWQRVHNFGRHAHIIIDKKTLCGRDVSLYEMEVQEHPTKKCGRCLDLAYIESLPEMEILPEIVTA